MDISYPCLKFWIKEPYPWQTGSWKNSSCFPVVRTWSLAQRFAILSGILVQPYVGRVTLHFPDEPAEETIQGSMGCWGQGLLAQVVQCFPWCLVGGEPGSALHTQGLNAFCFVCRCLNQDSNLRIFLSYERCPKGFKRGNICTLQHKDLWVSVQNIPLGRF